MTDIVLADLSQTTIEGSGVFDVLMRATKTHLEQEFSKNRIKGSEYATVYLGSVESVMRTSLDFLMQRQRVALEAELMAQQVLVAKAEVLKANAQVQVALAEVDKTRLEVELLTLNKAKIPAEIAHLQAQTLLVGQQKINLVTDELHKQAQILLTEQQTTNAAKEEAVLIAQECKLRAEFDLLMLQKDKSNAETSLLNQKVMTERAQVSAVGVDGSSVVGKQKALYEAQAIGFTRDAEQKAAKLLADTWNVRRTTDEGTSANGTNLLDDSSVGRAMSKLLAGIGA